MFTFAWKLLSRLFVGDSQRFSIVDSKKNIKGLTDYLYEASDLGLWYLELVLLAIFGYQGPYINRLQKVHQNGETEPVPWSNQ
jgi:hypothetical protein